MVRQLLEEKQVQGFDRYALAAVTALGMARGLGASPARVSVTKQRSAVTWNAETQ